GSLLVVCMDFRFHRDINQWIERNDLTGNYDLISLAGAQKAIVDPTTRNMVLQQIKLSAMLHSTKEVILLAHEDCGAYGGSNAFSSWEQEKKQYIDDMNKAESLIKEKVPGLQVKKMMLTFEKESKGINRV
ncbi:MAG TPA: carbonic anhydrase, partial [Patescibacteria group bacterium]|nr:carbonic anhydrase [Patescibacteria group bacterium]